MLDAETPIIVSDLAAELLREDPLKACVCRSDTGHGSSPMPSPCDVGYGLGDCTLAEPQLLRAVPPRRTFSLGAQGRPEDRSLSIGCAFQVRSDFELPMPLALLLAYGRPPLMPRSARDSCPAHPQVGTAIRNDLM
ncbi:hypothetical protein EHS25_000511 [Saitozyma podzolica]|uniref:Uncharacterized protein n=1 Tax=Saitozyma podzolica TaxID=1890683 RepID=A0A427YWU0_9TREE|nr:hypothetical protein EHS25_000511 [Saitozyma podzolica]